jgi:hypothetical protein
LGKRLALVDERTALLPIFYAFLRIFYIRRCLRFGIYLWQNGFQPNALLTLKGLGFRLFIGFSDCSGLQIPSPTPIPYHPRHRGSHLLTSKLSAIFMLSPKISSLRRGFFNRAGVFGFRPALPFFLHKSFVSEDSRKGRRFCSALLVIVCKYRSPVRRRPLPAHRACTFPRQTCF